MSYESWYAWLCKCHSSNSIIIHAVIFTERAILFIELYKQTVL